MENIWHIVTDPRAFGTMFSATIVMIVWWLNQTAEREKANRLRNERR